MKLKTLNEVFPDNIVESGIFRYIYTKLGENNPFTREIAYEELNLQYHYNRSGSKFISPLLVNLLDENDKLTDTKRAEVAKVIVGMYGLKWNKLFETLYLEYNPINNYDMTETETTNVDNNYNSTVVNDTEQTSKQTDTGTTDTTNVVDGTQTTTNETSETTDGNVTTTNNLLNTVTNETTTTDSNTTIEKVSAFDSTSYENKRLTTVDIENSVNGAITTTDTGTVAVETDTTVSTTGTITVDDDTTTTNKVETSNDIEQQFTDDTTSTTTGSNDTVTSRTLSRHGNIGVTTYQTMIGSYRELWDWFIFDIVFRDVDKVLTLEIY